MFFHPVKFYLPETLSPKRRSQITHGIERNGGERVDTILSATHIVTNSSRFHGWQDIDENVEVVSDLWVDRSLVLGKLLPCQFYSADREKIFSGIVGCACDISSTDLTHIEAGVKGLGGQWRHGLTKDVTHLFAVSASSNKYATAMRYQADTKIKVLLPHWFDDAVRLGSCNLTTTPYEWPDPKLLHPAPSEVEGKKEKTESSSRKLSDLKRAFYRTAIWNPDKAVQFPGPMDPLSGEVWGGRKVLISPSLGLKGARRRALEEAVEAVGGLILPYASNSGDGDEDEAFDLASKCDVYVTRYRTGPAVFKAFAEGKIVGTLNWLFYVHTTGFLSSPMDQLLHYPTRKAIEDFSKHQITVTNYTGEARDYIKRLIHTMGAVFTPNMTGSNTVLIAAHMGGIKTTKALSWSIPIVNHHWLEDCFVQWRSLTPAVTKYIHFPPNLDFAPMLAERGVAVTLEELETEEEEDIIARAQIPDRPPVGTEASAREVEGILDDGDIVMDDEDALEKGGYLPPLRRFEATHGARTPDPGAPQAKRTKIPPLDDPRANSKRRLRKELVTSMEDGTDTQSNIKLKGKGKGTPTVANAKVLFAPEIETDSPGRFNGQKLSSRSATSATRKRKAQLLDPTSNEDVITTCQSASPPPKKRAKPDEVAGSHTGLAPANVSEPSSFAKELPAGPTPRHVTRTGSLRALAGERTSSANPGAKRHTLSSSSSHLPVPIKPRKAGGATKTTHDRTGDIPSPVDHALETRQQGPRGSSGKKREEPHSADEMPPPKSPIKSKAKARKISLGSRPSKSTTAVRIMTTTLILPDPVLKTLSKLGAKSTSQLQECTHLIAPSLVRTEKLLCALAAGAYILSDKWAIDSAAASKLLPEQNYILKDKVNERKWNFRLVDAMARAKEVGEIKLLKNVVAAQGGKKDIVSHAQRTCQFGDPSQKITLSIPKNSC
ncbi:hypothetical protein B0H15DRAFT_849331 [Mycena belliarum]|uniref:BRCT domain-containing protein n=1 Tax=Mycena belliarum TaxID=1033014 RepID=A0AAD6U299_9AGAR|nr:hypothetical protein B0H15DRAFT_849331 [Mycena belliae]